MSGILKKSEGPHHGPTRVMASAPSVVQQARLMDDAGSAWHAVKCGNLEVGLQACSAHVGPARLVFLGRRNPRNSGRPMACLPACVHTGGVRCSSRSRRRSFRSQRKPAPDVWTVPCSWAGPGQKRKIRSVLAARKLTLDFSSSPDALWPSSRRSPRNSRPRALASSRSLPQMMARARLGSNSVGIS